MRKQITIAALFTLAAATGGAFAGTPLAYGQGAGSEPSTFVSSASRADVVAEAAKAANQGQVRYGQAGGTEQTAFVSTRSRAAVVAEAQQAQRDGAILYGQAAGSVSTPTPVSTKIAADGESAAAL